MNKYLVFPSYYKKSTQVCFFNCVATKLGIESIDYDEFYRNKPFSVVEKLIAILLFIFFSFKSLIYFNRKSIKIYGIVISHPIVETYLKEYQSFRFKRDINFYKTLLKAIKIVVKSKKIICEVELLMGGDEAYLFGSIYGQMAELNGVDNVYIKDFSELCGFKFNTNLLYAGISNYRDIFLEKKIEFQILERDLNAVVENKKRYFYMQERNIKKVSIDAQPTDKFIILFLHDFTDSPGVFGDSVFLDIPSWVDFCARHTRCTGRKLIVKTHPNALKSNEEMIEKLKYSVLHKYDHVLLIKEDFTLFEISNQINIQYVLTVYGSVIYEATYLGINVITCGNAPADFFIQLSKNAKNKSELKKLLVECEIVNRDEKEILRKKAITAFSIYQHFVNQSRICSIPYDFLPENIIKTIFNSPFDLELSEISPEIWKNSIRVENFIKQELNTQKNWFEKIILISKGNL